MKILAALLFLAILHQGAFRTIKEKSQSFLQKSSAPQLQGYSFVQGYDSDGGDIVKLGTNIYSLKEYCDSRPDCVGFNTQGWVKRRLVPRSDWRWFSLWPNDGTYIKLVATELDGYQFIQGRNSLGNDIVNRGTNLATLKQYCDDNAECLGFNTDGSVKGDFQPADEWVNFSTDPRLGMYVKNPAGATAVEGYYFIQGLESTGNDLVNKGTQLESLKEFCDSRSDCVGFNTNGWTKKALLSPRSRWRRFSNAARAGTYVKLPAPVYTRN